MKFVPSTCSRIDNVLPLPHSYTNQKDKEICCSFTYLLIFNIILMMQFCAISIILTVRNLCCPRVLPTSWCLPSANHRIPKTRLISILKMHRQNICHLTDPKWQFWLECLIFVELPAIIARTHTRVNIPRYIHLLKINI